ncbi:AI-2E family transporter [uncultured Bifidobacterium sp.]|uniref:AI-2E family transporter n=1 Tax=uncultured Bifidobacterium sp. TaxID=165187 RepID=UPI0028DBE7DD|nr:AI-2E family transporter [uncultured Bifidobacterium sp.]
MNDRDESKIDLASVFPSKGDPRRPPEWWGRALLYTGIGVFVAYFLWRSWGQVSFIVLDIVIAVFISLAIEPLVLMMVRHGWRRGAAAAVCLTGLTVLVMALLALFGNMFVQQMISMVRGLPQVYDEISAFVSQHTGFDLPEKTSLGSEILSNLQTSWVTDFAGQALSTTMGVFSALLDLLTVLMVTFYVSAAGPRMRRSLCQWLGPVTQRRFLLVWTVVQDQISGFLFSRTILAAINAACMAVFLEIIHVPSWLPLALFCGITSQFIPTVGTYIGGALPVVFAWGSNGLPYAVGVLVYIVVYQQVENLILSPKISQRTMDLNPAVAFLSVLVLGAVFGALGAFLALPVTASIQAIAKVYLKRYDLVDSPLMADPVSMRKSKVVEGAEAFNRHVIRPVSERIPRAARGSSSRAPVDEELRRLQGEIGSFASGGWGRGGTVDGNEDSATVAIPQSLPDGRRRGAVALSGSDDGPDPDASEDPGTTPIRRDAHRGEDDGDDRQPESASKPGDGDGSSASSDSGQSGSAQSGSGPSNPRAEWR